MAVGKAKLELFVIGNGAADEVVDDETPVPTVKTALAEVVTESGPTVDDVFGKRTED